MHAFIHFFKRLFRKPSKTTDKDKPLNFTIERLLFLLRTCGVSKSSAVPDIKDGRLYNPFAWTRWILRWTNIQTACLGIMALALWFTVFVLNSREYRVIDIPKPLLLQISESVDNSGEIVTDMQIKRLSHLILYALNSFSYSAPPNLDLLHGIANPNIISAAQSAYSANLKKITDAAMVQSIVLTDIPILRKNPKSSRISVIVKGFLGTLTQSNNPAEIPAKTNPYRAELTFILRPPSALNSGETLYLLQITEACGTREVSIFDEACETIGKIAGK